MRACEQHCVDKKTEVGRLTLSSAQASNFQPETAPIPDRVRDSADRAPFPLPHCIGSPVDVCRVPGTLRLPVPFEVEVRPYRYLSSHARVSSNVGMMAPATGPARSIVGQNPR